MCHDPVQSCWVEANDSAWWSRSLIFKLCEWEWAIRFSSMSGSSSAVSCFHFEALMSELLFGVIVEAFIAVSLAGAILALVIPALSLTQAVGKGDVRVIVAVVGVLLALVAVALFRPGSAIHRYMKR